MIAGDANTVTAADAIQALNVERLTLSNFRNYDTARLETGPGPIVITGPNGAGKTNLLEAVSLLAPGRGLRGAPFEQITSQTNPQGWAVAARLNAPSPREA